MIRSIVTDVEGTVVPYRFFREELAGYVRDQAAAFVEVHGARDAVREALNSLCREAGLDPSPSVAVACFVQCSAQERGSATCRTLAALIAEEGYRKGELQGSIYDDAARNLQRWHDEGLRLYAYSRQSIVLQQGLFAHSDHGDLSGIFSAYFDTLSGYKQESSSYEIITSEIGGRAGDILYLSDTAAELDAAKAAGMQTRLVRREGAAEPEGIAHTVVEDFDAISLN